MLLNFQKIHLYGMLLIFLIPLRLTGQDQSSRKDSVTIHISLVDSIRVKQGDLIAYKDTVYTATDTVIIRKEVWIRYRDTLVLQVHTIRVQGQEILLPEERLIRRRDTLIIIQDTLISRNERVLQQIKEFSERDNLFARLLKNILVFEDKKLAPSVISTNPSENSDKKYEPYEGKVIRSIDVKVLNVFGYSLHNPESRPKGFIEKGGNAVHIKSQRWMIRNRLLFEKGDRINSLKISESERLLRDNNFIYDAKIHVKDTSANDSVDVLVMVQDVWSISVGAGLDFPKNRYDVSVRDVNFLGGGQTLDNRFRYDPLLPKGYNYLGAYTINNVYKTFITSRIYYSYQFGETRYGAGLNREFISPAIKWAGGANVDSYNGFYQIKNASGDFLINEPVKMMQGDFWLGYGINISGKTDLYKGSRFILSGRLIRSKYSQIPELPDSIYNRYYDSYFYLGSFGIIRRRYYKDSYIFRFGRTEDIPEGDMIALTTGYESRNVNSRPYLGINMSLSRYTRVGYFYSRFGAGSFYENPSWNEGVVLAHFLYFSPLSKIRRWRWRIFTGARYTSGINYPDAYLDINQEQGLRGFKSDNLRGSARLVINQEINIFPPLNLLGFKMGLVGFVDLAWLGHRKTILDKNNFLPGYGIGIRFKNEHLIFNTIQVMLGFYPKHASIGAKEFLLFERSKFYYNYYNFNFSRPSPVPLL